MPETSQRDFHVLSYRKNYFTAQSEIFVKYSGSILNILIYENTVLKMSMYCNYSLLKIIAYLEYK